MRLGLLRKKRFFIQLTFVYLWGNELATADFALGTVLIYIAVLMFSNQGNW